MRVSLESQRRGRAQRRLEGVD